MAGREEIVGWSLWWNCLWSLLAVCLFVFVLFVFLFWNVTICLDVGVGRIGSIGGTLYLHK